MIELKRAAEMNLVVYLKTTMPSFQFYPSRGGSDIEDAIAPEPPFGVVMVDSSEQTLASDVWMLHGHVVWITSMDREGVLQASSEVRQIMEALKIIPAGYDAAHQLRVHGFDIDSTDEFSDGDRQARGDTIAFSMGITQG